MAAADSSMQISLDKVPVLGKIDEVRSRYLALQLKLRAASEDTQCHNSVSYVLPRPLASQPASHPIILEGGMNCDRKVLC